MLTLSQATSETRTILKWGGIILGSIFIILVIIRLGVILKQTFFPEPPPAPTVAFEKLPAIEFPENPTSKEYTFSLDTLTGKLPQLSDQAKIYRTLPDEPSLLALQKAEDKLTNVGFITNGSRLSENVYTFKKQDTLNKVITFDILSGNFKLTSDFPTDQDALSGKNVPSKDKASEMVREFLFNMSSFPTDIDTEKTKTANLSVKNFVFFSATSSSSTQIIRVDFFQKDVDKLPIYYPKGFNSTINALVSGGKERSQIVEVNYFHQGLAETFATYPLKTVAKAYEELKQNKGYIASYFGNKDNIAIKNISLGYYLGDKKQNFLMPIFVFEGDNGFLGYISAVTDEWIGK